VELLSWGISSQWLELELCEGGEARKLDARITCCPHIELDRDTQFQCEREEYIPNGWERDILKRIIIATLCY
jgi:hypothetical protein